MWLPSHCETSANTKADITRFRFYLSVLKSKHAARLEQSPFQRRHLLAWEGPCSEGESRTLRALAERPVARCAQPILYEPCVPFRLRRPSSLQARPPGPKAHRTWQRSSQAHGKPDQQELPESREDEHPAHRVLCGGRCHRRKAQAR